MQEDKRQLAAIMFTDIVGYTALMSKNEQKSLEFLEKQRIILKPLIKQNNGKWLKEMGDGTISSFHSTLDAVNCAVEIQKALKNDVEFKLRIGIHIGDIVFSKGDIFGDGVNVASRIEPLAEPGGICVSDRVYDDISNKPDLEVVFVGEKSLKNVDRPMKVYAIAGKDLPVPSSKVLREETHTKVQSGTFTPEKRKVTKGEIVFASATAFFLVIIVFGWILPTINETGVRKGKIDSLAILPFTYSGNQENTFDLSKGIPESILSTLQQLPDIKLISFSSMVQQYKGKTPSPADVGRDLSVMSVVMGRISLQGEDLSISVEIVDTRDNSIIVSNQYFAKLGDLAGIQTRIAKDITDKFSFQLTKQALMAGF